MNSDNVTVTQGRMKQAFSNSIGKIVKNETAKIVKEAIDNSKISAGVVTKFYPYLDKAEVQILNSDKKVLCKILHRFGGELIDFYTPNGDFVYDNEMKEKCIIPRGDLNCLVVDINSSDDEYLLLGYYNIEELVGINPATQGNLKICTEGGTNEFYIKFGYDGLNIRLPETFSIEAGNFDEQMTSIKYAESETVYTKEEVDEKIDNIEKGETDLEDYDVGFTYNFGLGGIDDTISIHTFLEKINDGE